MKKSFRLALLLSAFAFHSCQEEPTAASRANQVKQAYDLEAFLQQETQVLAQAQPMVSKTVYETGRKKQAKTLSSIAWPEELAPFNEADLNKPALIGLYTEEVTTTPAGHTQRRFTANKGAKTNLLEAVYTFDGQGQLLQVDAVVQQENMLFKTHKKLHLQAQPGQTPRLKRYRLDETQELMFMAPDEYAVEGIINP